MKKGRKEGRRKKEGKKEREKEMSCQSQSVLRANFLSLCPHYARINSAPEYHDLLPVLAQQDTSCG